MFCRDELTAEHHARYERALRNTQPTSLQVFLFNLKSGTAIRNLCVNGYVEISHDVVADLTTNRKFQLDLNFKRTSEVFLERPGGMIFACAAEKGEKFKVTLNDIAIRFQRLPRSTSPDSSEPSVANEIPTRSKTSRKTTKNKREPTQGKPKGKKKGKAKRKKTKKN